MRERKYVKFRVDMYNDTKFKIIDRKPERDLIHYVWTRIVTLAGKVNLEGDLYMSKTLPYTIETLAIEFNRDIEQVKLALDVFIELEMVELMEGNIYRVKNFAKHQNIKVKEKIKVTNNEGDIKKEEIKLKENLESKIDNNEVKEFKNEINQNEVENAIHKNGPILLQSKKNSKVNKNKKKASKIEDTDGETEDTKIICFYDSDEGRPLEEGERVVEAWSF
ncbi:hypothetical protein psyc5s11_53420 [Clostridium gelidum]|uniref:Phage replisome organiser N-terminal domain-containing protein n=1 Tax=Clostridium gelidum TaxID=704125 RepID=A0ABN6J4M7_9CLOT|nr:phage replisome organizer N-terminal domain-containing protein [Clostridium gelidum]BCZ49275.1 hypothetical protein psyc5s11_53420 [Clostridium gelidum]